MAKSQEERRARDREYKRAWRKENPEAERSRKQAYSEANREKLKESSLSYYARNKEACNKRARDYYRRNRERLLSERRASQLAERFGISVARYDELLALQGGNCGLCHAPAGSFQIRLAVDHCHETGNVRGLLCTACNRLLGAIESNRNRLPALLDWADRGRQDFIRSEREVGIVK